MTPQARARHDASLKTREENPSKMKSNLSLVYRKQETSLAKLWQSARQE